MGDWCERVGQTRGLQALARYVQSSFLISFGVCSAGGVPFRVVVSGGGRWLGCPVPNSALAILPMSQRACAVAIGWYSFRSSPPRALSHLQRQPTGEGGEG
jgi:hypothetical protein